MKILAYRIDQPEQIENIEDSLEAEQAFVGGYIEIVPIKPGLVIVCNEDGKATCTRNRSWITGGALVDAIYGDFFVARLDRDGELVDITDADVVFAKSILRV